jgi:hypothetical protein
MALVNLSLLNKFVVPEVPGCPTALVNNKIVTKVIEFCSISEAWRHDMTAINITPGQSVYTLDIPAETQIVGIKTLFDKDMPIYAKSEKQMDAHWPRSGSSTAFAPWRTFSGSQAEYFYQPRLSEVRLFPKPSISKTNGLTGTVSVKPLPDGTVIDEDLYNQFFDALAAGAKAELMAMPKKEWTNDAMVKYYHAKFIAGINEAMNQEVKSNQIINFDDGGIAREG